MAGRALIGVSCYADLARARTAAAQGADYVAFGRFFPSATKPESPPAPIDVLFNIDIETACGGAVRTVACIEDPLVILSRSSTT